MKYKVEIAETFLKTILVEADTFQAAEGIARDLYYDSLVEFDYNTFPCVEFDVQGVVTNIDEQNSYDTY